MFLFVSKNNLCKNILFNIYCITIAPDSDVNKQLLFLELKISCIY